jgi:ribosomal protein L11 methyltransferase
MRKTWIDVVVSCPAEVADELAARIADAFQLGVEVSPGGIRFYLEEGEHLKDWEGRLGELLGSFRKEVELDQALTYSHSRLLEQDWMEGWKSYFKPLRVGRHFLVCPTWERIEADTSDRVIIMDPGRAFGTGAHPSTRLAIGLAEDWRDQHPRLTRFLDLGCGSGILSIVAARLWPEAAGLAVDNDPEATACSAENFARNHVEAVTLQTGTLEHAPGCFDLVLANIQADVLCGLAETMRSKTAAGGVVILSGILLEQADEVVATYARAGLAFLRRSEQGEWAGLMLRNPG